MKTMTLSLLVAGLVAGCVQQPVIPMVALPSYQAALTEACDRHWTVTFYATQQMLGKFKECGTEFDMDKLSCRETVAYAVAMKEQRVIENSNACLREGNLGHHSPEELARHKPRVDELAARLEVALRKIEVRL